MTDTEIIETLRAKLAIPVGRHLYGVLGPYNALQRFAGHLQEARTPDGDRFPSPISVNRAILDAIPDEEFRDLAENEAKRPEPTARHVADAFERFLRDALKEHTLLVLAHLELLFAYNIEPQALRTLATDNHRILVLLPGRRDRGRVTLFPQLETATRTLPANLIAENHLWELQS
jgi:hypothetical protein